MSRYEYKFVRIGEGWLGVKKEAKLTYQDTVDEYARKGWRLVQVFAPGISGHGVAKYFELILERPV